MKVHKKEETWLLQKPLLQKYFQEKLNAQCKDVIIDLPTLFLQGIWYAAAKCQKAGQIMK